MKKQLATLVLASVVVVGGFASPASADTGSTSATVTVSGAGGLSISVPATSNLGSGAPGDSVSGHLGAVKVTDARALLNASWTTTVSATDFTTGGATSVETIPNINVTYWSGGAISTTGSGTFTPGQLNASDAQIINVPRTAFSLSGGNGVNSARWDPTVVIAIPANVVGGVYTGTVTHSVL